MCSTPVMETWLVLCLTEIDSQHVSGLSNLIPGRQAGIEANLMDKQISATVLRCDEAETLA